MISRLIWGKKYIESSTDYTNQKIFVAMTIKLDGISFLSH